MGLRLEPKDAVMEGLHAPARIRLVAARPGAADGEAWAIGRSNSRQPAFDQQRVRSSDSGGQDVFLRYTHATGWRVASAADTPDNNFPFRSIALAANGEGWAGTGDGRLYRRAPGSDEWRPEPQAEAHTAGGAVHSISLGVDAAGATYGFAVPEAAAPQDARLLVLRGGEWTSVPFSTGTSDLPFLHSVAAVSPDEAWVTGFAAKAVRPPSANPTHLLVARWSASAGWERRVTDWAALDDGLGSPVGGAATSVEVRFVADPPKVTASSTGVWVSATTKRTDLLAKPTKSVPPGSIPPAVGNLDGTFGAVSDGFAAQPVFVRFARDGAGAGTYCAPLPRVTAQGAGDEVDVCAEPTPLTTGVSTVQATGDTVMAVTTTGLLRFTDADGWRREPTVTLAATGGSFSSPDEGWLATNLTTGDPQYTHLGHWTTHPSGSAMRRWAQPATRPLEAIAIAPGSASVAVAVGAGGAGLSRIDDDRWDTVPTGTGNDLHAVAWAGPTTAWAVGNDATVLAHETGPDGGTWRTVNVDATGCRAGGCDLLGVAFDRAGRGWAVGTNATVLAFDGTAWRREVVPEAIGHMTLNAVAVAGDDVIAVGDDGVVLVRRGGTWVREDVKHLVVYGPQMSNLPSLNAVVGLPDGRAYVGGSTSVLLERGADGGFSAATLPPLEGSIQSLAVADRGAGRAPTLVATVGRLDARFSVESPRRLVDGYGWAFVLESGGWRELDPSRASGGPSGIAYRGDTPVLRDPVRAVALSADGRGWAVGGLAANAALDQEGHGGPASSTSSLWRLATAKGATPEASGAEVAAAPLSPEDSVAVAFVGDSPCASGLCSVTEGAATRADAMLIAAVADIDREVKRGSVDIVVSGGSHRGLGLRDELRPIANLFDELTVPWFGALGARDIVGQTVGTGAAQSVYATTPDLALRALRDRARPWGDAAAGRAAPPSIRPVADDRSNPTFSLRGGMARSHYAFDFLTGGTEALRVIVLDTSRLPLALSTQNPNENQVDWLARMLAGTRTATRSWPSIVVMGRPLVSGVSDEPAAAVDAASITTLVAAQAGAVVAGHLPTNKILDLGAAAGLPGAAPAVASGALGALHPEVATQGGFHAWVLVTFASAGGGGATVNQQGMIRVIPVLESVALHAPARQQAAGRTLELVGVGRTPDAGTGAPASPASGGPPYLTFPFPGPCLPGQSGASGTCRDLLAAAPDYRFGCEDVSICDFVRRDPLDGTKPFVNPLTGTTEADSASGLLCARNPGSTYVRLDAGTVAARMPITVTGRAAGPCGPVPRDPEVVPPPTAPTESEPAVEKTIRPAPPDAPPKPSSAAKARPMPKLSTEVTPNVVVGAFVPPVANVTPAPPGGSGATGAAHQREEEVQAEMASMDMRDGRGVLDPRTASAGLASAFAAAFWVARRRQLPRPATPLRPPPGTGGMVVLNASRRRPTRPIDPPPRQGAPSR